jgi:predicted membrane channel-forming protein YqfA (hemolysin III family)
MALSYRARRRLSLLILLVGVPLYVVVAVTLVNMLDRPSMLVELAIYVCLGVMWAIPFKSVFRGIGQLDPDAPRPKDDNTST